MSRRKQKINLVVFGHVNADESTLIGHFISNCHDVDKKKSKTTNLNEDPSVCSSILEKLKVAYECGDPIDQSLFQFETKQNSFQIIDVPGHGHFIKNLITGLSKADGALLFVSNSENDSTTYDHLELARLLSIEQMIILINETSSQDRFNHIRLEISNHMQHIDYRPITLIFLSISSIEQQTQSILWKALDSIQPSPQLVNKPLRLPLDAVYKIGGIGTVPVGRIATGTLKANMTVKFTPSNLSSRVKSIEMPGNIQEAIPGDHIGFNIEKINVEDLHRGFVCSDVKNDPAEETFNFLAYIVVLHSSDRISERHSGSLCCHTARVPCEIVELRKKFNRRSGRTIENHPTYFKTREVGVVKIRPLNPICLERFADYPPLGRFLVRDNEQTIIVGVVIGVDKTNSMRR